MPRITLEVTQEDIDKGRQEDGEACAIACTLKRFGYKHVNVDGETIWLGGVKDYELPKKAQKFIDKFDEDKSSVKPFSFKMTMPCPQSIK